MRPNWLMLGWLTLCVPASAPAQGAPPAPLSAAIGRAIAAAAQTSTQGSDKEEPSGLRLVWDDRPSLRAGKAFRLDLRVKLQLDARQSEQDLEGDTLELGRRRVGIEGELTRFVEFEVEREVRRDDPWRDVRVNVKPASWLQIQGGKFKMPFSADALTSDVQLDFILRSLIGRTIAPARDIGVMAHGDLFRRVATYAVGAFQHDGTNAPREENPFVLPGESPPADEHSVAARVTVQPFRHARGADAFERLTIAVSATRSTVPEGLNSLAGSSALGSTYFEQVYVRGTRRRLGFDAAWLPGQVGMKVEYAQAREQRLGQGLGDVDLSDYVSSGWLLSGAWVLTGEHTTGHVEPRAPLFAGGFGAVELAVRYDTLGFGSASHDGPAFANPRAEHILENRDRLWTFAVNWYLNKWSKIQLNGVREAFEDPERSPVAGQKVVWSGVCRLQFVL